MSHGDTLAGPPGFHIRQVSNTFRLSEDDLKEMERLFNAVDTNKDGMLGGEELKELLNGIKHKGMGANRDRDVKILLREADTDDDKQISKAEFFAAMRKPGLKTKWGLDDYNFDQLTKYMASVHEDNPAMLEKIAARRPNLCWPPPFFLVLMSIVQIAIFIHYSGQECDDAPTSGRGGTKTECPLSYSSVFAYRMCCRDELWRWFTYALMHQGWAHLAINVTMQLAVGFFLEVINGPLRIFYLYLMGIIGGSLAASVFDSTANVVGCSGAVYSILGAWVASLTINWDTMHSKRKYLYAGAAFILIAIDNGSTIYQRYFSEADATQSVSVAGHTGGLLMGLSFGTYILRNGEESKFEAHFKWFGTSGAATFVLVAVLFNSFNDPDIAGNCLNERIAAKCHYD